MLDSMLNSLLPTTIGALIGTFLGTFLLSWKNEHKNKELRNLAISALKLFESYIKDNQTYSSVTDNFNNKFNIAQKRSFLVLLHSRC